MTDKYLDPRNIAFILEHAALASFLRTGNSNEATVTISVELAHVIAAHLRRAPLRYTHRPPLSLAELHHRKAVARKARQYKAELIAAGENPADAEDKANSHYGIALRTLQRHCR
jgi:hypothetical protein